MTVRRTLMNQKEIKELIEFLVEKDIAEFELERGDVKLRVKRSMNSHHAVVTQSPSAGSSGSAIHSAAATDFSAPMSPAPTASVPSPALVEVAEEPSSHIVRSPIVGSFYESPSPGAPAFVKVGDHVEFGQPLCIIEAMKLMNEIESDAAGEIVKILVGNGQPVEYSQPLFAIRVK